MLRSQRANLIHDRGESLRIDDRDVREDLAIELDLRLLQSSDQAAVADVVVAGSGRKARDPELAEVTLLGATIAVSVDERAIDRFSGALELILTAEDEAFGTLLELYCDDDDV